MLFIKRNRTNPWFNISAEEFVLKYFTEDVIMLWESSEAVIVGKHQNPVAEVNLPFVYKHSIPVIRRISGGGTVVHGKGNLNFTHISTKFNKNKLIDFQGFTLPVIEFLKGYGIDASFKGKNNLYVTGKKFSGNSAHIFKNKIIHHGTLLFDADIELLQNIIKPSSAYIADKSIPSVRTKVGNLKPYFPKDFNLNDFKTTFKKFLINYFHINDIQEFTSDDAEKIEQLANKKYKTIAWNFGYSPNYFFKKQINTVYGKISAEISVSKGIISDIRVMFEKKRLEKVEKNLIGLWHEPETIRKELSLNMFTKTIMEVLF